MDKNMNPWTIEIVTPSDLLISKFEEFDRTRSTALWLRSFNRARKWISNLINKPLKVPETQRRLALPHGELPKVKVEQSIDSSYIHRLI